MTSHKDYLKLGDTYINYKIFRYDVNNDGLYDMKALISDIDSFIEALGDRYNGSETFFNRLENLLIYKILYYNYYTQEEIDSHNTKVDIQIEKENLLKEQGRIKAEAYADEFNARQEAEERAEYARLKAKYGDN